jgi:hypothetical protein
MPVSLAELARWLEVPAAKRVARVAMPVTTVGALAQAAREGEWTCPASTI